jgi:hypothetical protein
LGSYQTTRGEQTTIDGQNVLNYTEFNFVGTQLTTPLDISEMTHFSVDIMMLELLILTFFSHLGMKILILSKKPYWSKLSIRFKSSSRFKDTDFKAGGGKL